LVSIPAPPTGLYERWDSLRNRLSAAAARADRPAPVFVAVTKSVPAALAAQVLELGQLDLGESRVQSLELKSRALPQAPASPRWHMIGHLQGNKARRAVALCHSLHSVDSKRLLESVERLSAELGRKPEVYLELDYVQDGTRTGLSEPQVRELLAHAPALSHAQLCGLMTIAPRPDFDGDTRRARQVFVQLRRFAQQLPQEAFSPGRPRLSMGMSSDFEIACEEGSDCVRIGSALFEDLESPA
jgi:pyridoxal phosphate enzyme (YggS family)